MAFLYHCKSCDFDTNSPVYTQHFVLVSFKHDQNLHLTLTLA